VDTARNYYARNAGLNEGINKPYNCHDFLIINGQNTLPQMNAECSTKANAISGLNLASKTIQRNISGANVFDPVIDTTYCPSSSLHTVTVTITGATPTSGGITVVPSSGTGTGSCVNSGTPTAYTCSVPNNIGGDLNFAGMVGLNSYTGTTTYSAGSSIQAVTLPITLASASTSCLWSGGTVANNGTVTAYQSSTVPYGSTCASEQRTCTSGVLSSSFTPAYDYTGCAVQAPCTVPNIVGDNTNSSSKIADVDAKITAAGFLVGTKTTVTGSPARVTVQNPASGGLYACRTTAINYTYRP